MGRLPDERGDVILFGLLKLVAGLLVFGLVLFEGGAVAVNRIQLDEAARVAARQGAVTWAAERSTAAVDAVVRQRLARETAMTIEGIVIDGREVAVTVVRPASVLLIDRIGPLSRYAQGRATSTSGPGSR